MRLSFWALSVATLGLASPALAHPDGAPWGSSNPDTLKSCAACHFDREPVGRSPSLMLAGLPENASAGEAYELTLRFEVAAAAKAGFLLSASNGAFEAIDAYLEANGGEIRSTKPSVPENGAVTWTFLWRAGTSDDELVTFRAAANGADNDLSPFGDKIHFRKFEVFAAPAED